MRSITDGGLVADCNGEASVKVFASEGTRGYQLPSEGTGEKRSYHWKHRLTLKIEQGFRKLDLPVRQHWTISSNIGQHFTKYFRNVCIRAHRREMVKNIEHWTTLDRQHSTGL